MATILKKINHNTILIEDDGEEKMVTGKGIGFRAVRNREFDMKFAEKVYTLYHEENSKRFIQSQSSRTHIIKQYI